MQVKELKHDGLSYELEITIPANDIDARVNERLKEVGKTMKLPGFRPGKVPQDILKKRYGKAVMGEVLEKAVNETSAKAMQDKGIRPAMQPKIEVKEFDDGKDLVYSMAVETLPKFELIDFKKMKLEKPVSKPDDKKVEDALERLAANSNATREVTSDRGAKEGDTLVIDFHGRTADDNVAHEGMHSHDHHLVLGSNMFIPGFEDQLIGKKAGEKVEVKVSFPENYGAKDLAGRDAIFDVDVKKLREPSETKIDADFAKSLGLEDLKALKDAVKEQLQKEYDEQSRLHLKKAVLDYIDDNQKFDVPETMLEMEHQNIIQQVELDRQRQGKAEKLTDKEKKEYHDIAERRVRLGLVLSEIGSQNKMTISDPELNKAVIMEAQKYPGQEKEVFDYYSKNRHALESLRAPLYEEKVIDFILELAEIKEKEVDADILMAPFEDEAEEKPKKSTSKKTTDDKKSSDKKPAAKKSTGTKKKSGK